MSELKAFYVTECELWAAPSANEAKIDYETTTGEACLDEYPQELTGAELDVEYPEFDEDECPTGGMNTVRQMLLEHIGGTGFLAGTDW